MAIMWNPWRGCRKCSEGCKHCYIHKGDARRGVDTGIIDITKDYNKPIAKKKDGEYRVKSGQLVYLCFSTDFLIEEADQWRSECWKMIRERSDLHFLFLTKRIQRLPVCIPTDWGDGYDNVTIGCTCCNERDIADKLPLFNDFPIKHRNIILQPLLEQVDISRYLENVELVVVGGESDRNGRTMDYGWVLSVRQQCMEKKVDFQFRQCSTYFVKDGKTYKLQTKDLTAQARKAGIDLRF